MYQEYRWRGERILDIRTWAEARGERMIKFRAKRTVPSLITGGLVEEVEEGEMPESFWRGLLWQNGWRYEAL